VSQHVSGIIMPIIRRMVQNRQRLWCTALAVLQQTRGEEVVRRALVGIGFTTRETNLRKRTSSSTAISTRIRFILKALR
jgi:hypothetical protein